MGLGGGRRRAGGRGGGRAAGRRRSGLRGDAMAGQQALQLFIVLRRQRGSADLLQDRGSHLLLQLPAGLDLLLLLLRGLLQGGEGLLMIQQFLLLFLPLGLLAAINHAVDKQAETEDERQTGGTDREEGREV